MKAAVAFAAVLLLAVEAAGQRAPRTAWGHPDLQGTWTNVTATPLERPPDLAGKSVLTEEERAERFRQFTGRPPPTPCPASAARALTTSTGASAVCCCGVPRCWWILPTGGSRR